MLSVGDWCAVCADMRYAVAPPWHQNAAYRCYSLRCYANPIRFSDLHRWLHPCPMQARVGMRVLEGEVNERGHTVGPQGIEQQDGQRDGCSLYDHR